MQILDVRRCSAGTNVVARFDVELDNGIRLYDLKLTRAARGWRVYGPQHHGGKTVTLPIVIADLIAEKAVAHVEASR